ncbi:hypothetical protein KKB11_06540, partial [Candidatus Micrarchaeota archaeon]|nr:hypothetical protein [Candidatus Micrarchaeota archaeon]
ILVREALLIDFMIKILGVRPETLGKFNINHRQILEESNFVNEAGRKETDIIRNKINTALRNNPRNLTNAAAEIGINLSTLRKLSIKLRKTSSQIISDYRGKKIRRRPAKRKRISKPKISITKEKKARFDALLKESSEKNLLSLNHLAARLGTTENTLKANLPEIQINALNIIFSKNAKKITEESKTNQKIASIERLAARFGLTRRELEEHLTKTRKRELNKIFREKTILEVLRGTRNMEERGKAILKAVGENHAITSNEQMLQELGISYKTYRGIPQKTKEIIRNMFKSRIIIMWRNAIIQTGSLEGAMKVMRKRTFRKDLERRGLNVDELITKGKRMIKERQRMQSGLHPCFRTHS